MFRLFLFPFLVLNCLMLEAADYYPFKRVKWNQLDHQIRPTLDEYAGEDVLLYRFDKFDFYRSNSGTSGENFRRHSFRQLAVDSVLDKHKMLMIRSPFGGRIVQLDYRVWKDGNIIYLPKKKNLKEQLITSLTVIEMGSPILLRMDGLEPGCVLEVFYKVEGVRLPNYYLFNGQIPIQESQLEIKYRGKRNLVFNHSPMVSAHDTITYGNRVYTFRRANCTPGPQYGGLPIRMGINPYVELDWRDVIDFERGKFHSDWFEYVADMFFDGEVKDYNEFVNEDNFSFGYQIYLASQLELIDYYRMQDYKAVISYVSSFAAAGFSKDFMQFLDDLDLKVDSLAADSTLSLVEGITELNSLMNQLVINQMSYMPARYITFTDYSLLSKYYFDFLRAKGYPAMPMLLKLKRYGPIHTDYISRKQFNAMAMGFMDKGGKFHFTILGPYLGSFYGVDHFPSEFSGGQAIIFDLEKKKTHTLNLPYNPPSQDGFKKIQTIKLDFANSQMQIGSSFELYGSYRNKIFHGYLIQPDSARDGVSASRFVKKNNGVFNRSSFSKMPTSMEWNQDADLKLDLKQGLISTFIIPDKFYTALPFPYEVEFRFNITADQPFEIEWEEPEWPKNEVVEMQYSSTSWDDKQVDIVLKATFKEHFLTKKQVEQLKESRSILSKGIKLKVKKKE